jgi:hypothetical protein
MRVGEGEGGPNLAEHPVTRGSAPRAAYFSQWRAGDREGPRADWSCAPTSHSWPRSFATLPIRTFAAVDILERPQMFEPNGEPQDTFLLSGGGRRSPTRNLPHLVARD